MTATITEKGTLRIMPETEIESYAIQKWVEENLITSDPCNIEVETLNQKL